MLTIVESGDRGPEEDSVDTSDFHVVKDKDGSVIAYFAFHDDAVLFCNAMEGN